MASTGEVACLGSDLHEAFLKEILATGFRLPERRQVLLTLRRLRDQTSFLPSARLLHERGFTLYATRNTSRYLQENGVPNIRLYKISESPRPSLLDYIAPRPSRPDPQRPRGVRPQGIDRRLHHPPPRHRLRHPVDHQSAARRAVREGGGGEGRRGSQGGGLRQLCPARVGAGVRARQARPEWDRCGWGHEGRGRGRRAVGDRVQGGWCGEDGTPSTRIAASSGIPGPSLRQRRRTQQVGRPCVAENPGRHTDHYRVVRHMRDNQ